MSDTIAAVSTGTQVCAIGIVRMSGGKAIEIGRQALFARFGAQNGQTVRTESSSTASSATSRVGFWISAFAR